MARRRSTSRSAAKPRSRTPWPSKAQKRTDDYRHSEHRPNNPEAGLQSFDRALPKKVRYQYDPHLDPQLVWASKAEHTSFEVETVSLHIHERISTQAILKTIQREDPQRNLFGDPQLPLTKAVQFYQHGVDWANRLILGDSLLVMNSLLHREMLAGKVQMIYIDPPYGVSYNSNFQPRVDRREVRDGKDDSLTREPEQIKAYRDTWTLGIHSYLTYMRDRLLVARELLHESGSVFVQISDENVHLARGLLDELFGRENFCSVIVFRKTTGANSPQARVNVIATICDFVLWYGKDINRLKYRQLYIEKDPEVLRGYNRVELPDGGGNRSLNEEERGDAGRLPPGSRVYQTENLTSMGFSERLSAPFVYSGREFRPPTGTHWKTTPEGLERLASAGRLISHGNTLNYKRYLEDFPVYPLTHVWTDIRVGYASDVKLYAVQTSSQVSRRCLLMSTDPGDLVFDPTCGSGTTAYVAEQWGRRWITCDTSRVALALARQRLMTASFPYYRLAYPQQGVAGGFVYEEVLHITLKSVAQNLPPEKEKLYDKSEIVPGVVRVAGPFTVEAINTLDPGEALAFEPIEERARRDDISHRSAPAAPVNDHLAQMTDLLRRDGGLSVPGKGRVEIEALGRITSRPGIHAEGTVKFNGKASRFAVAFGPRYGPVTARLVEEAVQAAVGSYDALAVAGFSFDPEVSAFLDKSPPAGLRLFRVQIAPDVLVGDLLKTRRRENLFAVVGDVQFSVERTKDGLVVKLEGVDVYDPNANEVLAGELKDIAAWFVDHDYDGRCFCVCQVFLPAEKGKAFEKLQRALKGTVDEEAWEALSGFESRPFKPGEHKCVAVKVIDVRGSEVVGVRRV